MTFVTKQKTDISSSENWLKVTQSLVRDDQDFEEREIGNSMRSVLINLTEKKEEEEMTYLAE